VSAATLDLTGVVCPLNWVRTKLALEQLAPGEELSVRLDPGEPLESVPRSASEDGHQVSVSGSIVTIVKGGPAAATAASDAR
jgi:TusA-related sulfurtransferase